MSMGTYWDKTGDASSASTSPSQLFQGEIVSVYRKFFINNDMNSCFMHGMLKYMAQIGSIEMMEYCTQESNLSVGDIVTFNFSADKQALNPYANSVKRYDFSAINAVDHEMKQTQNNGNHTMNGKQKKNERETKPPFTVNGNGDDHDHEMKEARIPQNDDNRIMDNMNLNERNKNKNEKRKKNKKNNKIENKPESAVRLICISDTHNSHDQLTQELTDIYESESDILIHCGDMTDRGSVKELQAVNKWFAKLPYKHIIVTAGNMDGIGLDKNRYGGSYYDNNNYYDNDDEEDSNITNMSDSNDYEEEERRIKSLGHSIFTNAIYLEHESYHLKEYDLRFFASPYSMRFVGGFQVNNDKEAQLLWKKVPTNTDILICHGPPLNILDSTSRGKHAGDSILYDHVMDRIQPKVMLFGHMHSSYGYKHYKGIHFYNCAQNNSLNGGHHSYSYSYSSKHKKNQKNNHKQETPHIIDLSQLA